MAWRRGLPPLLLIRYAGKQPELAKGIV